ncbi:hypothetical protein [Pseudomonas fluorescens]|uniref:hypothetical protein n=1 Tax=Pseudomonas atacamensis TaxID=2565368 RepID=UPI00163AF0D0
MSTRDEHMPQPAPAPTITYPEEASTTGPATLLLGSGMPDALVQVWNIENTQSLGAGLVSAKGRWAFSISGAQAPGQQKIHAHQTYAGITSEWSDERGYEVRLRPEIDVPGVFVPLEGAEVNAPLLLSGDVTRAEGFVSIFDLDTGLEIARAAVESDRKWQTPAAHSLAVGQYRISAVHNIAGQVSDWGRVRTFTVVAEASEGLFDFARLRAFIQNALRKISSIWR